MAGRSALALGVLGAAVTLVAAPALAQHAAPAHAAATASATPIQHVVIIDQENHSFDEVLGVLCVKDARCDGTRTGKLHDGSTFTLTQSPDVVPNVTHSTAGQQAAIDGGKMDGWDLINGCQPRQGYRCMTQYTPEQIPNTAQLARRFALSDRTFEMDRILSFGAHVELVSVDLDGLLGTIPQRVSYAPKAPGWGCQSNRVTAWVPSPGAKPQQVPSCVPFADGTGTFWDTYGPDGHPQTSPLPHVDNLFDRMDAGGASWKVYDSAKAYDPCSYFASCRETSQGHNVVMTPQILNDAQNGTLPNVSLVMPNGPNGITTSQHNGDSMKAGDDWIGQMLTALGNGPEWGSTAVFITYDDCGCFYDHVPPPDPTMGVRLPMVIISPYAKAGYTDSTPVSFVGMIAFIEHTFNLPPVDSRDASSYDYMNSFDFTQTPLRMPTLVRETVPPSEVKYLKAHQSSDEDDPT